MSRVLVVGDLLLDVVAVATTPLRRGSDTPARVTRAGGGAGANVAAWLAAAGAEVTLACRVGDDAAGREAVADLRRAGIEVRAAVDPRLPTGTCVVLVEPGGERSMLPDRGASAALAPADIPRDGWEHLHLSGYVGLHAGTRAAGTAALEHARATGRTISVDPASAAPIAAMGARSFLAWLGHVDLLLPNAAEAVALTGLARPQQAAQALTEHAAEVVVTLAADGALWTDGTAETRVAPAAVAAVDTTGAGDAFAAGYLHAILRPTPTASRGNGPPVARAEAALAAGRALAARAVAGPGARPRG